MSPFESSSLKSLFDVQGNGSLTAAQKGTLFVKMRDGDGSGGLSKQEAGITADRFGAADANKDGQLAADEIAREMARPTDSATGRIDLSSLARSLLAARDKDQSGGISAREANLPGMRFAEADTDGNGSLDAVELAAHMEKGLPPQSSVVNGQPLVQNFRSVALEGAMSLLGGANYSSPWYSSPQGEKASSWFG